MPWSQWTAINLIRCVHLSHESTDPGDSGPFECWVCWFGGLFACLFVRLCLFPVDSVWLELRTQPTNIGRIDLNRMDARWSMFGLFALTDGDVCSLCVCSTRIAWTHRPIVLHKREWSLGVHSSKPNGWLTSANCNHFHHSRAHKLWPERNVLYRCSIFVHRPIW